MNRFLSCLSAIIAMLALGAGNSFGQAAPGMCYATTGGADGRLYTIDLASGAGTLVADTGARGLPGLAVSPSGTLFATTRLVPTLDPSILYRIDATTADTVRVGDTGVDAVDALAFNSAGILYGVGLSPFEDPLFVMIDSSDASVVIVDTLSRPFAGLAFDPTDGTLFASTGGAFSVDDEIWTIDPADGTETFVGVTGRGGATPDIAFDAGGQLFGFKRGPNGSYLIEIDKTTAAPDSVGEVGSASSVSGFTCYHPDAGGGGAADGVYVDIKPQACPNQLNTNGQNTVNVAILGTADFDVADIDVGSIQLAGLSPWKYEYEDVSRPPLDDADCACTEEGPDGYVDLKLKFKNQDILETLGPLEDGDEFTLLIEATLNDATNIAGEDCVVIQKPNDEFDAALEKVSNDDENGSLPTTVELRQNYPNPFNPSTTIGFGLPSEGFVEVTIFNSMGQRVTTLVSSTLQAGRYTVTWDATDDLARQVASGLYIYRIVAGEFVRTQTMLLLE